MTRNFGAPEDTEQSIAAFVRHETGSDATRIARVDSFPINAVYEVDTPARRFIVKTSKMHDALRAEAWACARGALAGCAAPAIVGRARLLSDATVSAFIMSRVDGRPIRAERSAYAALGADLRRLHAVRLAGFGWLAEAAWDTQGNFTPMHSSWLGFLKNILRDTRGLADPVGARVADAAAAAINAHADALAAVEVGALCHGDLKPPHILVDNGRLTGVIDWGDAVIGDPFWDIARFAHRADARSLSLLLDGYDADSAFADDLAWRVPLYGALWTLVDAIVDHRLGYRAQATLELALDTLARSEWTRDRAI
jgi:aminoglycoside phosphotransferase (APT) family kinase protein